MFSILGDVIEEVRTDMIMNYDYQFSNKFNIDILLANVIEFSSNECRYHYVLLLL